MDMYKVLFEDGQAISAELVDNNVHTRKIQFAADAETVEWYIVECDTPEEALNIAAAVVQKIWGVYGNNSTM